MPRFSLIATMAFGCTASLAATTGVASAQSRTPAPIVYANGVGAAAGSAPVVMENRAHAGQPWALTGEPSAGASAAGPSSPASTYANSSARAVSGLSGKLAEPYAGAPYEVEGKWYVPMNEPDYDETGIASWYGPNFHGKPSASGEIFDTDAMTAAHPTLPIPSLVRVTNQENGRQVVVRLNDRGPFVDDRIIDLSRRAAEAIDMTQKGTARVRVEYLGPAPVEANATPGDMHTAAPAGRVATPVASRLPDLVATPAPDRRQPLRSNDDIRGFFVQAGSFVDLSNALQVRDGLQALGPVFITETRIDGAEHYRVMIGPWASRDEAAIVQGRVVDAGGSAFVVAKGS